MSARASDVQPALLSHDECVQILSSAVQHTFELQHYSLAPLDEARGHLGEYYVLTLHYYLAGYLGLDENSNWKVMPSPAFHELELQELRVFVKCVPRASKEPEMQAIFAKEVGLYSTLLTHLQRYTSVHCFPRCHYARPDLLALEHLLDRGYALRTLTGQSGAESLNERAFHQLLRSMAAMHAASIAYESKEQINIGSVYGELLHEITVAPSITWWTTGLRAVLAVAKAHPKYQSAILQRRIEAELVPRTSQVYDMVDSSSKYHNVLCHRDAWMGNVFFHDNNSAAIFVDYQTARYCPPAIDIIFALFMNLDAATRNSKQLTYLQYYYEQLGCDLRRYDMDVAAQISEAELLATYWEFQLFGMLYKAIAMTVLKVPRSQITKEYLQVERTATVLEFMKSDVEFRECMQACVEEMVDYALQNELRNGS